MARSAQYIDNNGFLLIKGCPVSAPGIFDYSAAQVGETEGANHGALDRIVRVFRPAAAVNDPEFIESLKNVPLIDDHEYMIGDEGVLDSSEHGQIAAPEEKGVEGVMTDNVYWADPWLRADLKVFSRRLQAAIKSGKRDLSLGYVSHFEYNPGVHDGMPYDYIQTNMRGNHIALVDEGRVPGARVLDGLVFDSMSFAVPSPSTNNPEESAMDENMLARLTALLPQLNKLCGVGAEGAEGGETVEVAADPDAAVVESDESELTHNEHEREAGAETGVEEVVSKIEALLGRLKEGAGAKAEHQAAAAGDSDTDAELTADADDTIVVDNDGEEVAADAVSGLEDREGENKIVVDNAPEGAVPASEGPKKGVNTDKPVGDAVFKAIAAQVDDRNKLASRLSGHIGTFDHARMTAGEVAVYGCKKLNIPVKNPAHARMVLDGYLLGAAKAAPKQAAVSRTADSSDASGLSPQMRKHLGL